MSFCCAAQVHHHVGSSSSSSREEKKNDDDDDDDLPPIVDKMIYAEIDRILDCTRPRKYAGSYSKSVRAEFDDSTSLSIRLCSICGKKNRYSIDCYHFCTFCGGSLMDTPEERHALGRPGETEKILETRFRRAEEKREFHHMKAIEKALHACDKFLDLPKGLEEYAFRHFEDEGAIQKEPTSLTWQLDVEDSSYRVRLIHDLITGEMALWLNDKSMVRVSYQETDIASFDLTDRPVTIMVRCRHIRTCTTWSEWEYEVCTNGRTKSRDLISRRHLRMSHWKIPSSKIVGGHVLLSYCSLSCDEDDERDRVYADGAIVKQILHEKSSSTLLWSMNDGLNKLELNVKRNELKVDGELMTMESTFIDSKDMMRLVPSDITRCKLLERKVLIN